MIGFGGTVMLDFDHYTASDSLRLSQCCNPCKALIDKKLPNTSFVRQETCLL